jgi:hypothetical protein
MERAGGIQRLLDERLETMERLMSKKHWVFIILSCILLFHFINNFIWLNKDNFIIAIDANWHIIETVKFHLALKKILLFQAPFFSKTGQLIHTFRYWPTMNWPPLVYFLSALMNPHEIHLFSLRMYINFIFFVLLILSIYFLGKKCFNRRAGLIAAFLISFYPAVGAYSRQFGLDFPLLAFISVCLCLLVYSENFSKRGYSLLFGLSLGMGTLVKLQIMFFLLAPLLYALGGIFRQNKGEKLNGCLNFIFSSAIALSLFYSYWGNRAGSILTSLHDQIFFSYPLYTAKTSLFLGVSIPIFSLVNFVYYLESLLAHVYLLPFLLFVCAMTVLFISKNKWRFFYFFSFLIPYFIISFISVKSTRYALPLLVFMAVLSGWLVDSIRSRYMKILMLCLLIFYSVNFYFFNSWTHKRFFLVPRSFLKLTGKEISLSNLFPPHSCDYTGELKTAGIIPYIERQVRKGKIIKIAFIGLGRIEDPMALLYMYFQDAILNGKIIMRKGGASGFQDVDCIFIRESDLSTQKDPLKNYKILAGFRGSIFLIKNEKNVFS